MANYTWDLAGPVIGCKTICVSENVVYFLNDLLAIKFRNPNFRKHPHIGKSSTTRHNAKSSDIENQVKLVKVGIIRLVKHV